MPRYGWNIAKVGVKQSINQLLKTEYMPRNVVWLVNISNCLAYDWVVKDDWNVNVWDFMDDIKFNWKWELSFLITEVMLNVMILSQAIFILSY